MKVVINTCYGGFGLSHKAIMRYAEMRGLTLYPWIDDITLKHYPDATFENALIVHYPMVPRKEYEAYLEVWRSTPLEDRGGLDKPGYFSGRDLERNDPILLQVVELLGKKANGRCADLKIIDIPDGVDWEIDDYDGLERVDEKHRSWD